MIRYEAWPPRPVGGQHVGTVPNGVRGVDEATGVEAFCDLHRSQFKNRKVVQEMIEWALSTLN